MFSTNPCDRYFSEDNHSNFNFFTEDLGFDYDKDIDLAEEQDLFEENKQESEVQEEESPATTPEKEEVFDNISVKVVNDEPIEVEEDISTNNSAKKSDLVMMSINEIINSTGTKVSEDEEKPVCTSETKLKRKKRSNLSNTRRRRKDIIFKSILRRCRKFYQSEFNNYCNYSRVKKRRAKSFFFEQIAKFYVNMFGQECPDLLIFAAFLNSKDTIKSLDLFCPEEQVEVGKERVNKIHDILYKFTHEKMGVFFEYSLLSSLFKKFVEAEEDSLPKGYKQQLEAMLTLL